jgi:predicted SAM-dependent methyltransferase
VATATPVPDWDWEDPPGLADRVDAFTASLASCEKLELVAPAHVFTGRDLRDLGLTGIEFAAFRTHHQSGLASDLVGLHSPGGGTEPGQLYRVDGSAYFLQWDVCEPLPFEDGSVDWVYAEHLIEHVSLKVGVAWLTEVRRILRGGGLVRLTTPDLRRYAQSYVNGDSFFAKHRRRIGMALTAAAPPMPARDAFMFNQLFYVYGHRWIYDADELRYALSQAGFDPAAVRVCSYRTGARADVAALDQVLRNDETIYVEADA